MIKGIIFDLDDTLLRTKITKSQAFKALGKQYNVEISDEALDTHWGKPFRTLVEEVFMHIDDTDSLIANYMTVSKDFHNEAYEDALDLIKQLSGVYELGILSSASRELIVRDLAHAGLGTTPFRYIQAADDTDVHKPDPLVFQPILTRFATHAITPSELLYIGDMPGDFLASTGAGLTFIGIADHTTSSEAFNKIGATSVTDLRHIHHHLQSQHL